MCAFCFEDREMSEEEKRVREQIAAKWASHLTGSNTSALFKLLMWDLETDRMCYSGHFMEDVVVNNEMPDWLDELPAWYHQRRA